MPKTFDSRDAGYKNPAGAVSAGADILITVKPESARFPLKGFLRLRRDGEDAAKEFEMKHEGLFNDYDLYTHTLKAPEKPGLLFYSFRFENAGGSFYYGPKHGESGGEGDYTGGDLPPEYQLTVYKESAPPPAWFMEGVTYNIFPDRFYRTEVPKEEDYRDRERKIHVDWFDIPDFRKDETGEVRNRDFFGGSLRGIMEKLPYLGEMHVGCIYLNPIFEAFSNHRYDTADYLKIDPMLGTEEEFAELCKRAGEFGIRIILDGVFSHTGSDSVYFNKDGRYGEGGAYRSEASPYYGWFHFDRWPDKYRAWWGIKTLPEVSELTPSYLDFMVRAKDSVVRKWVRAGASGFRLDVADELPDEFIFELRRAVSEENPEAVVIGEVWEDASNKISYDERRRYILGGGLHGLMNYPFKDAAIEYLKYQRGENFRVRMETLLENYPRDVLYSSMNLLSTHDVPRILTVLGAEQPDFEGPKEKKERLYLPEPARKRAKELLKIGAALAYAFPGTPLVYYGDEAGLEGFEDPFNRRCYPWGREDMELLDHYRALGKLRAESPALKKGDIRFVAASGALLAFTREYGDEKVLFIGNTGEEPAVLPHEAAGPLVDLLSGEEVPSGGIEVPGRSARLLWNKR